MCRNRLLITAVVLVLTGHSFGCEPVLPFLQAVVPITLAHSLWWLLLAVVVKAVLFSCFQRRIHPMRAGLLMVAGNVLTTIIGFLVAAFIGAAPAAWWVGAPFALLLCWIPSRRLVAAVPFARIRGRSSLAVASLLFLTLFMSCLLFAFGGVALESRQFTIYWFLKIVAVLFAVLSSMALTTIWEEWTIWRLGSREPGQNFFTPVLRANLYVMVLILAMPAIIILPKRLKDPNFIAKRLPAVTAQIALH